MNARISVRSPKWAILIPTIPRRAASLYALTSSLFAQINYLHGLGGPRVNVYAWLNEGTPRLAEIRDEMLAFAERRGADYVSFIDDDDLVSDDYVRSIWNELHQWPDHVGFKVRYTKDGEEVYPGGVEHRLGYGRWGFNPETKVLYRDFTHIDPIRTNLARKGRFAAAAPFAPEDREWVKQVRPYLYTERYIHRELYHYRWQPEQSAWDRKDGVGQALGRRGRLHDLIQHRNFLWHPESL